MIGYEGASLSDFSMYFSHAWVWHCDVAQDRVIPYILGVPTDQYEEPENESALGVTYSLYRVGRRTEPKRVRGRTLTTAPHYILHRFDMEYIPIGDSELIRVSSECAERRAFKGMNSGHLRYLPLLENDDGDIVLRKAGLSTVAGYIEVTDAAIADGIASVLAVGSAPCVRRLWPDPEVRTARARYAVRRMFNTKATVCVPDFPVALVRKCPFSNQATVLHRGCIIGRVVYADDQSLTFIGEKLSRNPNTPNRFVIEGNNKLALRLFATHIG